MGISAVTIVLLSLVVLTEAGTTASPSLTTVDANSGVSSQTGCQVLPADEEVRKAVLQYTKDGVNLIKYNLNFQDYDVSPLDMNVTYAYEADQWQRVFNRHGEVLLALTFNYDVLSLFLLQFGVTSLDVALKDEPKGCFGKQDEDEKIDLVKNLLLRDFADANSSGPLLTKDNYICHQVITESQNADDVYFSDQCCQIKEETGQQYCKTEGPIPTITILYYLLIAVKIGFILYGPLLLDDWVYKGSMKKPTYIVPLTENIEANVNCHKLNKLVPKSKLGPDQPENQRMTFEKLHIKVDSQQLISEKRVPVGLFRFLIDNFLRCKITRTEPFNSCCTQSIFGSWSRFFLCIPLRKRETDCNARCKKFCSWRHIFVLIGGILSLGFVSLPFIIRLIIYYVYEASELDSRREAVEALGYELSESYNIFQHVTPTDGVLVFGYVCYFSSFIILALLFKFCRESLDAILNPALEDLEEVRYIEAVRMFFAHLILPFDKFGIFGILIGVFYWPFAIPVCLIALVCYCVPTLYLVGRFLIHKRPWFLDIGAQPKPTNYELDPETGDRVKHSLTYGAKSVDTMLKLNNISPADPEPEMQDFVADVFPHDEDSVSRNLKECFEEKILPILIGIVCIINMLSLIFMYAEVIGFIAEIILLSLMGAIINASFAHKYIMLAFWILMYTVNCYNRVYENYMKLNTKLFGYMKSKLSSQVLAVTLQKATMQKNTAFKYFTRAEIHSMCEKYPDFETNKSMMARSDMLVENKRGKVFWNVRSLALFVDRNDVARIPRKLFFAICEEELEGCPGPVYKSLAIATKQLMYMVIFLMFVFLIILAYGSVYSVSSTNQLLLTLAGGFLPSIVRFVITPNVKIDINLNTYTFEGRIQQLMYEFTQLWPVAILNGDTIEEMEVERELEKIDDDEENENNNNGIHRRARERF